MKTGLLKGLILAIESTEKEELNKDKIVGILELILFEEIRTGRKKWMTDKIT